MGSPESVDFVHHVPGGGEATFVADPVPELAIEAAIIDLAWPEHAGHADEDCSCEQE